MSYFVLNECDRENAPANIPFYRDYSLHKLYHRNRIYRDTQSEVTYDPSASPHIGIVALIPIDTVQS